LKQYVAYDGAAVPSRQDVWKAAESANMKQLLADSELRRTLFKIYQDPSSIKVLAEVRTKLKVHFCIKLVKYGVQY
jgi:hypothetical protein